MRLWTIENLKDFIEYMANGFRQFWKDLAESKIWFFFGAALSLNYLAVFDKEIAEEIGPGLRVLVILYNLLPVYLMHVWLNGRAINRAREEVSTHIVKTTVKYINKFSQELVKGLKLTNVDEGLCRTASTKSGRIVWIQRDRNSESPKRWAYVAGERFEWDSDEEAVKDISTWE